MARNDKKSVQELVDIYKELNALIDVELHKTSTVFNQKKKIALEAEKIANNQRLINELKSRTSELSKEEVKLLRQLEEKNRRETDELEKHNRKLIVKKRLLGEIVNFAKMSWTYLQKSDDIIKSTNLTLGLSSMKADAMRASFEQSAGFVARIGGNIQDIAKIMTTYADETGRARALTAGMVDSIELIANGTGLGVEQAAKLGAEFEYMGLDAKSTMEYVQGVVDTSERMGVNTTKVLQNITKDFKKLSTYTFQGGVKAMAEMAMNAEKTRVSMETALNVAETTRSLDKVIELGANLQIMGGEFAKMDPFQWLYTVRNEPDKLIDKISEMTKGLYTLRKNSEGVFERIISPADRDRLANVAKSLGISQDELFRIAQRKADLLEMEKELSGLGLSKREKDLIQGAATFNAKQGKFQVQLAGTMYNLSDLTEKQAHQFQVEQKTLQQRAEEAMNFDKAFKATIEELKSALLPILRTVNKAIVSTREFLRPAIDWLKKGDMAWLKVAGAFIVAGTLWKSVGILLGGAARGLSSAISSGVGGLLSRGGGLKGEADLIGKSGLVRQRVGIGRGAELQGAGISKAGTGVAALGIGAGIMLAAKGISELAKAMNQLDGTKIWALPATVLALSASFWALSPAIAAAGAAGTGGAIGLLALGAAVVGVGFGINLATKGIGKMAEGLGKMMANAKGAGKDMMQVGVGMAAMASSLGLFMLGMPGLIGFGLTLKAISKHADDLQRVGNAFREINTVLSGSREDYIAIQQVIESIANTNLNKNNAISELSNLFKNPIKVQFADKEVAIVSDITLNIDGQKFMEKVYKTKVAIQKDYSSKKLGQE